MIRSRWLIGRDKAPEYALYLLNRNAVKNTLVALVPGEMKATRSDEQALQLARRGERVSYGLRPLPELMSRAQEELLVPRG